MPLWVWPMQVWAKQPLLSPKDKQPWPCIPLPKIQWMAPLEGDMAQIYALLGDADHAVPILKRLLQIPSCRQCDYSGAAATRSGLGPNPQ